MTGTDKPEWWLNNERLRAEMGLAEYRPPRFADGPYTHRVVDPLEETHDCRIQFIGVDTRYSVDWGIRIDGIPAFGIGRHRDEHGNTVYEMTAGTFRMAVDEYFAKG